MRSLLAALATLVTLAACGHPAPPTPKPQPPADAAAPFVAPGLRLPRDIVPTAYDLALELDPDTETFTGRVTIHARVVAGTDRVWLHAVDLDIASITIDHAALAPLDVTGEQMRGFHLPRPLPAGSELAIAIAYTGKTTGDEQGLFRQQSSGRWYLYAQGESVFARRIVPCFDEPAFEAPWTIALTVPDGDTALALTPQASERRLADGRREVVFAPTRAIPSYLVSVAVGPFDVVDAGVVGRANIPLRVAVPAGEGDRARVAAAWTGKLVAGLETYFDDPLPLAKLDLVGVPRFFGAMENPGLITMQDSLLVGDAAQPGFGHKFARVLAHELAHQWLGDAVTFAWWDDLWLSEAFATWLGDKVAASLGAFDDLPLRATLARQRALAADAQPDAKPLRRPIEHTDDPEAEFDAIEYDKGSAVLAMFERLAGEDHMRAAVRAYVHDHRGGSATSAEMTAALSKESPDAGRALASYVEHAGTPIVDLELRCDGTPRVAAKIRTGSVIVPVCIRFAGTTAPVTTCALVDGHAEIEMRDVSGCPQWVMGNADGIGYYEVSWNSVGVGPMAPVPMQTPAERLVLGTDIAAAVVRGDIAVTAGLAELRRLTVANDPYADLAATSIARAIEPFVDEATNARWWDYLAERFAARVTPAAMFEPTTPALRELRDTLIELVPGDHLPAATIRRARGELDRTLAELGKPHATLSAKFDFDVFELDASIAAPSGGARLFDQLEKLARAATDEDVRFVLLDALGRFGPDLVDRALALYLDGGLPPGQAWVMVRGYFARSETRAAAWVALAPSVAKVFATITPEQASQLVADAAPLCDATGRDAIAAMLEPHVADIPDGKRDLAHALAVIDRCVARRGRAGDVANALRR